MKLIKNNKKTATRSPTNLQNTFSTRHLMKENDLRLVGKINILILMTMLLQNFEDILNLSIVMDQVLLGWKNWKIL
jgi:hypothetical protein